MAQDNEYVQKLIAARDREVAHRRDIAEVLAEKRNRGDMENMGEAFIKIQDVIEAIERAVWHERYIAGQVRAVLAFRLRKRAVTGVTGFFVKRMRPPSILIAHFAPAAISAIVPRWRTRPNPLR
jgi:hypothetical protein